MKHFVIWVAAFSLMSLVSPAPDYRDEEPLRSWKDHPVQGSLNQSCTIYETECALGCCPYPDAVCCLTGYECCQQGKVCIPFFPWSLCIGAESEKSLTSSEPAHVRGLVGSCPRNTTACGVGCCPFPDATCCKDERHCCPNGFSCDLSHKTCVKNFPFHMFETKENEVGAYLPRLPVRQKVKKMTQAVPKHFFKACPGSDYACPKSQNCCVGDDGEWSCCPKPPSKRSVSKAGLDCCYDMFDILQCCDDPHVCTYAGCI